MRQTKTVLICLLLLLVGAAGVIAGNCTPPASGDWIITDPVICENVSGIILNGNLMVQPEGSLLIKNSVLYCCDPAKGSSCPEGEAKRSSVILNGPTTIISSTIDSCGVDDMTFVSNTVLVINDSRIQNSAPLVLKANNNVIANSIFTKSIPYSRSLFGRPSKLLTLENSQGNTIRNNIFSEVGKGDSKVSGKKNQPPGLFQTAVELKNSQADIENNTFSYANFGLGIQGSNGSIVQYNTFTSIAVLGLGIDNHNGVVITGNIFDNIQAFGLGLASTQNAVVDDNTFVNLPTLECNSVEVYGKNLFYSSIVLGNTTSTNLRHNEIKDARCGGITSFDSSSNNIQDLKVTNSEISLIDTPIISDEVKPDASSKVHIKWLIDIWVEDDNENGITGAIVKGYRNNGIQEFEKVTASLIKDVPVTEKTIEESAISYYNNYTINASVEGYSPEQISVNISSHSRFNVTMEKLYSINLYVTPTGEGSVINDFPSPMVTDLTGVVNLTIVTDHPNATTAHWYLWHMVPPLEMDLEPDSYPNGTKVFWALWNSSDKGWNSTLAISDLEGFVYNDKELGYNISHIIADNYAPVNITDLRAVPDVNPACMDLYWTAPIDLPGTISDDPLLTTVSGYEVRYSTVPILTEADWQNANVTNSASPLAPGSEQSTWMCNPTANNATYYFAVKSYDEFNHNSTLSNNASGNTARGNDVSVDYAGVYKNGVSVNIIDARPVTVYSYDTLVIKGNITNNGIIPEWNVPVDLFDYQEPGVVLETRYLNLSANETKEIIFDYVAQNFSIGKHLEIRTKSTYQDINSGNNNKDLFFDVWSVKDATNLHWFNTTLYPAQTQKANTNFFVTTEVDHINQNIPKLYGLPLLLTINGSFTINGVTAELPHTITHPNSYYYLDYLQGEDQVYEYWTIKGPLGVYNISVILGEHDGDQQTLSRTVTIIP